MVMENQTQLIEQSNSSLVKETYSFSQPVWQFVMLSILSFGIYNYRTHRDYRDLIREEGLQREIFPGYILITLIGAYLLSNLPEPYWLVSFFVGTLPLAIVQGILNEL